MTIMFFLKKHFWRDDWNFKIDYQRPLEPRTWLLHLPQRKQWPLVGRVSQRELLDKTGFNLGVDNYGVVQGPGAAFWQL